MENQLPQEVTDAIEGLVVKTQNYYWSNPRPEADEIADEKAALVAAIAKAIAEASAPGVRTALNECIEGARVVGLMEDIKNPKAEESEALAEAYAALNSAHMTLDREITEYAAAT